MIPTGNSILTADLKVKTQPSKQYMMVLDENRIVGTCDKLQSVRQAVFKILSTERYEYPIYSWNYGIELKELFGKSPMYVCPEIERRVKEALLQDDRITNVTDFNFDIPKNGVVSVAFTVHTIFGKFDKEMAVNI